MGGKSMSCHPTRHNPGLRVRTDLQAGSMNSCLVYCDQELGRCYSDPNMPKATCDDRYPVCQNACTVCGTT
jgi:hypothetical protein